MKPEIADFNHQLSVNDQQICDRLAKYIDKILTEAECKIWHAHPVWFIEGNPIVGYSKQKKGVRLMFWSGADFKEEDLNVIGKKFKDASIFYNSVTEIDELKLHQWLEKAKDIQWDYKNIVKRQGKLERLK